MTTFLEPIYSMQFGRKKKKFRGPQSAIPVEENPVSSGKKEVEDDGEEEEEEEGDDKDISKYKLDSDDEVCLASVLED